MWVLVTAKMDKKLDAREFTVAYADDKNFVLSAPTTRELRKKEWAFDAKLKDAPAEYWIWDGIHPLPQGHEVMARLWLEAINK